MSRSGTTEKLEQWRAEIAFEFRDSMNEEIYEARLGIPTTPWKNELNKICSISIEYVYRLLLLHVLLLSFTVHTVSAHSKVSDHPLNFSSIAHNTIVNHPNVMKF